MLPHSLGISDTELASLLQVIAYVYERASYELLSPEALTEHLGSTGLDEEKVRSSS